MRICAVSAASDHSPSSCISVVVSCSGPGPAELVWALLVATHGEAFEQRAAEASVGTELFMVGWPTALAP
eukprot:2157816-Alexandrium_andersonii.AAC.1